MAKHRKARRKTITVRPARKGVAIKVKGRRRSKGVTAAQKAARAKFAACARKTKGVASKAERKRILKACFA